MRSLAKEARTWSAPIETVADLVNNLLMLDQDAAVFGAYFLPLEMKDRCRARSLSISKERVTGNRIRNGNDTVPYSFVIWTTPDPDLSQEERADGCATLRRMVENQARTIANLKLQAQAHAHEARGANATIREIYRIVTCGTGEPGNWHGAEPVRSAVNAMRADIDRLTQGYRDIKTATIEGRVCDDVAWFDTITTLHDFCDCMIAPAPQEARSRRRPK